MYSDTKGVLFIKKTETSVTDRDHEVRERGLLSDWNIVDLVPQPYAPSCWYTDKGGPP